MGEETETLIRVEQFSEGEKVFVFNDLRFTPLYPADVLYATKPLWIPIEIKLLRGDEELPMHVELHGAHLQGGGHEVFYVNWNMLMYAASVQDFFQVGDIIRIDTPVPNLECNIRRRWYDRGVKLGSPWKERFAALDEEGKAAIMAKDEPYTKGRFTKAREKQYRIDSDAHDVWWKTEHWPKYEALEQEMRDAIPLPEVLRFTDMF